MAEKYFEEALHRFTMEVAADGAIRHLRQRGLTAEEIKDELDYPVSLEYIRKKMSELEEEEEKGPEKVRYERAFTKYGKPYFIEVKEGQ
ncbi:MAG: hypothetical protein II754_00635 [Lachnospiraceae bacterium]|nr:hypothetical protein [Lachnospiraceae bacterium]